MLKAIRQATHTNRVFGSELFQKQIEAALALHTGRFYSDPELPPQKDSQLPV